MNRDCVDQIFDTACFAFDFGDLCRNAKNQIMPCFHPKPAKAL